VRANICNRSESLQNSCATSTFPVLIDDSTLSGDSRNALILVENVLWEQISKYQSESLQDNCASPTSPVLIDDSTLSGDRRNTFIKVDNVLW
jgi:hypothetical protein